MTTLAFFCYVYVGSVAPISPSPTVPANCIRGEWLPVATVIMPGTYTDEDTRLNRRR